MPNAFKRNAIYRILDANVNRAKEGLRVCEEITRFILQNRNLTLGLKGIRHKMDALINRLPGRLNLLKERESTQDVGRKIHSFELERRNYQDIFFANIQRVKESVRVLEEFLKLADKGTAIEFKKIRYGIYEIEKKVARRFSPLRNYR